MGIPKFEYVSTEWDSLIPGLKAKRWDIIWSGMTVTEERRQGAGIDFSRPYYFESDRLAVKGDGPIQSPEDLKDKVIGAATGTVEEIQARSLLAKGAVKDVKFFADFATPFLALENGQIDAYVVDNTTYGEQKKVTPNLRTVGPVLFLAVDEKWKEQQDKVPTSMVVTASACARKTRACWRPSMTRSTPWMPTARGRKSSRNTACGTIHCCSPT